jgi:tRNA (uracil-5-)-methyltransferase TRM9
VDDATARALNRINAAFYGDPAKAAAFSATRERAWPGWQRLLGELEARGLPPDARVLDVGCGNARLGRFLAAHRPGLRYVGLDASPALLAHARPGELGAAPRLLTVDLLEEGLGAGLARHGLGPFDLVACFGVLHHVPGRARRLALLAEMLAALAPGGLVALTCWQLAQFARFRDKTLAWREAGGAAGLDPAQLEPGDHLLPFRSGGVRGLRYVHFAHEGETAQLLAELPCQTLASFVADGAEGNLNRYFVARGV